MKEVQDYSAALKKFNALEKELQTAKGRASEIQERVDEEKARLAGLTEKKRDAAKAYAGGGSPVTLNKVQGEIAEQQALLSGLEETLAMVEDVVTDKKRDLAQAELVLSDAHRLYWYAEEGRLEEEGFVEAKRALFQHWRASRSAGRLVTFRQFKELFFRDVHQEDANEFPLEPSPVPEDAPRSDLLNTEDRKYA